jgi:hypothetical protein
MLGSARNFKFQNEMNLLRFPILSAGHTIDADLQAVDPAFILLPGLRDLLAHDFEMTERRASLGVDLAIQNESTGTPAWRASSAPHCSTMCSLPPAGASAGQSPDQCAPRCGRSHFGGRGSGARSAASTYPHRQGGRPAKGAISVGHRLSELE